MLRPAKRDYAGHSPKSHKVCRKYLFKNISKDLLSKSEFLFYTSSQGNIKIEVFFQNETVWLTQQLLADLFDTTKQNISLHLTNIFQEGELSVKSVVKEFLTTASDGKQYQTKYYNLDAIIAVGYRVNSKQAISFHER